jgi:G3E family GTPase
MLENTEGKRIACIVNDMAEVNIDAALIRGHNALAQAPEELVQLQNGCALCAAADECAVELTTAAPAGASAARCVPICCAKCAGWRS